MDPERLRNQHYRFRCRITETAYSVLDEYHNAAPGIVTLRQVVVKRIPFKQPRDSQARMVMDKPSQDQLVAELMLARAGHNDGDHNNGDENINRHHPNVVQVQDVFVEQDSVFIVMEYCTDGDLLQHVHAVPDDVLGQATAIGFTRQILLGVQFMHTQCGIAHRGLSLENILLRSGAYRTTNFELSTRVGGQGQSQDQSQQSQLCSEFVGKEFYMAPEIVACKPYDPVKADMWSISMVLLIILTGEEQRRRVPSADGWRRGRYAIPSRRRWSCSYPRCSRRIRTSGSQWTRS